MQDEREAFIGREFRRFECRALPPFAIAHPGAGGLILIREGIGQATGLVQRDVNVARRVDVDPVLRAFRIGKGLRLRASAWIKIGQPPAIERGHARSPLFHSRV